MAHPRRLALVAAVVAVGPPAASLARGGAPLGDCVACPAGATIVPDDCDVGDPAPNDQVNGGCNATPPAFSPITCGETVCGTTSYDRAFRGTDSYRLDLGGKSHQLEMTSRSSRLLRLGHGPRSDGRIRRPARACFDTAATMRWASRNCCRSCPTEGRPVSTRSAFRRGPSMSGPG
jgi:hypothetical protein